MNIHHWIIDHKYQVVDYFKQLEKNAPSSIKVEKYGATNEKRDLIVAYISTPENLKNLNRKQNISQLLIADIVTAKSKSIYTEQEKTWIDIMPSWDQSYANGGWDWLEDGKQFLWSNESDGWRHFYIQSIDGTNPICITPGNFDVMKTARVDFKNHQLFYSFYVLF